MSCAHNPHDDCLYILRGKDVQGSFIYNECVCPIHQIDEAADEKKWKEVVLSRVDQDNIALHLTNFSCMEDAVALILNELVKPIFPNVFLQQLWTHMPNITRLKVTNCIIEEGHIESFFASMTQFSRLDWLEIDWISNGGVTSSGREFYTCFPATPAIINTLSTIVHMKKLTFKGIVIDPEYVTPMLECLRQLPDLQVADLIFRIPDKDIKYLTVYFFSLPSVVFTFSYYYSYYINPERLDLSLFGHEVEDAMHWMNSNSHHAPEEKTHVWKAIQLYNFLSRHGTVLPTELMVRFPTIVAQKKEWELLSIRKLLFLNE